MRSMASRTTCGAIHGEQVAEHDEHRPQQQVPAILGEVGVQLEERSHAAGRNLLLLRRLCETVLAWTVLQR